MSATNCQPIPVSRASKEQKLQQRGIVVWLVGLSGAGKSTLAASLDQKLFQAGFSTALLDGDILRLGLNANLGFTEQDRHENIRRAAETAKLLAQNGLITICSFITPTHQLRELARGIVGPADFFEVFLQCSFTACAQRDTKGLYQRAMQGDLKNFTGWDAPFDVSGHPWLILDTENDQPETCSQTLFEAILPLVQSGS